MADENKLDFVLNLDDSEFAHKIVDSIEKVEALGSKLVEFGSKAGLIGSAMLAVYAAVEIVKETIDNTFEAEKIRAVAAQFDILAQQAGLAGDAIKDGMTRASGGLINETELLTLTNKSIIDLGASAARLPQIMELARKAAMVTGQDVATAFQNLEQALATGQTRALKQYGIIIDQQKAYREYAASIGEAAGTLSKAGEIQAIMNQALEIGRTKYANVQVDVKEATNAWQAFKVTMQDIGEIVTLAYDRIAGPTVRSAFSFVRDWAQGAKTWFEANYGEGAKKAAAQTEILEGRIKQLKVAIIDLDQDKLRTKDPFRAARYQAEIVQLQDQLKKYQAELGRTEEAQKKAAPKAFVGPMPQSKEDAAADAEKKKRAANQFTKDMLAIEQQVLDQRKAMMTTGAEAEEVFNQERVLREKQTALKIQEIRASDTLNDGQKASLIKATQDAETEALDKAENERIQIRQKFLDQRKAQILSSADADKWASDQKTLFEEQAELRKSEIDDNEKMSEQQKADAIAQINDELQRKLVLLDEQKGQAKIAGDQQEVERARGIGDQMSAVSKLNADKAADAWVKSGGIGGVAINSFQQRSIAAFKAIGDGSKSAGDAMKMVFLGMIGDMATAAGQFMMLDAFKTFPAVSWPEFAAGGALVALGSALGASASGTTATPGGGSVGAGNFASSQDATGITSQQTQQKAVTIQVMGSYFETEQTKTRLVEMIREASDASDFTIKGGP